MSDDPLVESLDSIAAVEHDPGDERRAESIAE
jgi:hypothetical protein